MFGKAVKCSRCCRHRTSSRLRITLSLFSAYSSFFYFRRASRQKRQKWFTRKRTRAHAVSDEKWFVRSSSKMLASLLSSHFIPAAHNVSLFFDFRRAYVKNVRNGLPGSALERAPFQRRSDLFAQAEVKSQSSIMLASLSSSHFIPAAHHVSSF